MTAPAAAETSTATLPHPYRVVSRRVDTYDTVRQHLVSHHFTFGEGRQARLGRCPQRYIWPAELDLMGRLAGFELESRHADWTGAEFTTESSSHVSIYRLPS